MKRILLFIALSCTISASAQTYTLQQLKDSALHNNFAIRSGKYNIEAAQQQRKEAFTKYFPSVSGRGLWFNANRGMAKMDINPSEMMSPEMGAMLSQILPPELLAAMADPISISMMKNGTIAGLQAVQPVFVGGQIINGNRLAKVGEDVSRLQLQLSENEVEKTVEQYFWQLVSLQEKMKTIAAVDTLLGDIHKDVDVAVRAGIAMRNDLLQVQLRQNDVESQRLKLQNAISIVKQLLGQYCGLRPSTGNLSPSSEGEGSIFTFEIIVPDMDPKNELLPSPVEKRSGAEQVQSSTFNLQSSMFNVQSLPEYQLLDKQVEATKLQHRMEVGTNLPTVAVGAGYNYHNLLENNHTFGMIFATVSVPISDWWGGFHAVKRKKIEYQKAQEQLADNAELLEIRMLNAWNGVVEARQQLDIAQRSIEQAEENLRLNRNYYRAGTSTMSNLLEAQLLYQQSLDRRTDAFADYQNKLLAYRHASGQALP
ncbi:MAG: TolC family protein [Bacteroidales bacterium]|nr:TolC family protein [Bacteroidales bacterium]